MNKKEIYAEHLNNYDHQYISDIPSSTKCQIVITDGETKRQYVYETFDKSTARLIHQCITKVSIKDAKDTKGMVTVFNFDYPASAHKFIGEIVPDMEFEVIIIMY